MQSPFKPFIKRKPKRTYSTQSEDSVVSFHKGEPGEYDYPSDCDTCVLETEDSFKHLHRCSKEIKAKQEYYKTNRFRREVRKDIKREIKRIDDLHADITNIDNALVEMLLECGTCDTRRLVEINKIYGIYQLAMSRINTVIEDLNDCPFVEEVPQKPLEEIYGNAIESDTESSICEI